MNIVSRTDAADKHAGDVNQLLFHKGKLYSACDDGKIKVWDPDLKRIAEVRAHVDSVYCLAASEDCLFSCSKKGNIKSWELGSLKEKKTLNIDDQTYFFKIHFSRGCLFYGEDRNNIKVFENIRRGNVKDEDNYVSSTIIFTVKDEDVVVSEVKTNGTSLLYGDKKYTFSGKNPVTLIGNRLFAFVSVNAKDIYIHDNSPQEHFMQLCELKNAHTQEIKALSGATWNDQEFLFSGGLDNMVRKWNVSSKGVATMVAECNVNMAVKTVVPGATGELYVGGKDGQIIKLK